MPLKLTGYVLHAKSEKESGLKLEVLTYEHGKQTLFWRHAKSKFAKRGLGFLQFTLIEFQVQSSHHFFFVNQLDRLSNTSLQLDGKRLLCGMYINELLCKLYYSGQAEQALFSAYQQALSALADKSKPLEQTLRLFELTLLQDLGYGYEFNHAANGNLIVEDARYHFDPEQGFIQSSDGNLKGAVLLDIANGNLTSNLTTLKYINRLMISKLNNYQPLESRKLFQQLYE